jgi:hypothetical protein
MDGAWAARHRAEWKSWRCRMRLTPTMAARGGGAQSATTLLEQRDTNAVHNQCGGVRGGTHDESAGPRPDMPASTQRAESDEVGRERKVATWEMRASLGKEQRPAATMAGATRVSVLMEARARRWERGLAARP